MNISWLAVLLLVGPYTPVVRYDPARSADRDIREAVAQAQQGRKRILLEVGGEWCSWCHIMDNYFEKNPKLTESRERSYITVKINYSPENENKDVLSRYPAIKGYPHIFVLESDGKLLQSQNTSDLEEGQSYNLAKFTAFLDKWAPPRR